MSRPGEKCESIRPPVLSPVAAATHLTMNQSNRETAKLEFRRSGRGPQWSRRTSAAASATNQALDQLCSLEIEIQSRGIDPENDPTLRQRFWNRPDSSRRCFLLQ